MRDPIVDLREIARLLDRHGGQTRRAQAFRKAAATLADLDPAERADVDRRRAWGNLPGVGATTTKVIAASHAGRVLFIRDGVVFHQIYRGECSDQQLYKKISDTLTMLRTGRDAE